MFFLSRLFAQKLVNGFVIMFLFPSKSTSEALATGNRSLPRLHLIWMCLVVDKKYSTFPCPFHQRPRIYAGQPKKKIWTYSSINFRSFACLVQGLQFTDPFEEQNDSSQLTYFSYDYNVHATTGSIHNYCPWIRTIP